MSDTNSKVGKPVTFSLDGKTVEARPGETLSLIHISEPTRP